MSAVWGLAVAVALFAVLAGRMPRVRFRPGWAGRLARRAPRLVVVSIWEEVLWRGLVLGVGLAVAGTAPALVASTAGFALAHARRQGARGVAVHLVTGAAFGGVALATGSLLAAVLAHAAYNVLVAAAFELDSGSVPLPASVAALEAVRKRYRKVVALDGVTLEVREGEIVALLGPNGAGKTTAVALLLGLRRADDGRAVLFGGDPRAVRSRRLVGAAPQDVAFSPTLAVREIVDLVRAHYDEPEDTASLLGRFGLEAVARRQAGGLSGGQRRRLAVALAFAGGPRAVFLDEPTSGLDVDAARRVWGSVRDFARGGGSVLLTTHRLEEADALADRVVVLARGRVVADAPPAEIKARAGVSRIRLRAARLPPLEGVADRLELENGVATVFTRDPGAVVRLLVLADVRLDRLEVEPVSLEDAFLALTR